MLAHYICNLYGYGPCSCPDEMISLPTGQRTAATPGTRWRSGTRPTMPDVQMTRSSSVGGGVFRGTCGYLSAKKTRTCSHLHVAARCIAAMHANQNQSACYVVSCTEDVGSFPIQRQLCSGIPSSQTYSRPTELCSKYDVDPAVRAIIMCRTL